MDETTPWGSSGIKAYWNDEGGSGTESKAKFDPATLRLKKAHHPGAADGRNACRRRRHRRLYRPKCPKPSRSRPTKRCGPAPALASPKALRLHRPAGQRAKESGQAADTIVAQNLSKMRARMHARSYRRAVWHINNDCPPQLDNLLYATTATNRKIYNPERRPLRLRHHPGP